jgi:Cytochrome c554 and c-prime
MKASLGAKYPKKTLIKISDLDFIPVNSTVAPIRQIKNYHFVLLVLVGLIYLGSRTVPPIVTPSLPVNPQGNQYVGSTACVSCHKDIVQSHLLTAHYRTSRPASATSIKGSFESGKNKFIYNRLAEVDMESKDDGFWQTEYLGGALLQSCRFDIVVGSGKNGQTYLYWKGDYLYQLPVSYYVPLNEWGNSPGYPRTFPLFTRQIPAHCLECHGTYARAEVVPDSGTRYPGREIMYGVDCERCHGPGGDHVTWHANHPGEKTGKYILDAKLMGRQQRLDACALCHSGARKELKPTFSFQTGDTLDQFSTAAYSMDSLSNLDVHGNQYGLLVSSKCFQKSGQMDCSSCHNVHVNEANNLQVFSQRCMNCHNGKDHPFCTMPEVVKSQLTSNCIDCHMPLLPSRKIFMQMSDSTRSRPDLIRTHRIAVYAANTKNFMKAIH